MAQRPAEQPHEVTGLRGYLQRRHEELVVPGEGLRERKKRLTRQQISDTATALFLARGFDEVRVAEVAEACGVSEKTVYNYFPTKESLMLDREPEMAATLRRALDPDVASPVQALRDELTRQVDDLYRHLAEPDQGEHAVASMARFAEIVETTPSLKAAQRDMADRLVAQAAERLAEQLGRSSEDPEPQVVAASLVGLWAVQQRAMRRVARQGMPLGEARDVVVDELHRAAVLVDRLAGCRP